MKRSISYAVIFVGLFLGCATTPVAVPNARPIEANRILEFKAPTEERSAHIVVIRDEGFGGSGCFYAVHINGVLAARMAVAERVDLFVPPGEILFRVGRDPLGRGLCAVGSDNWTQRESVLKAGETKFYRLSIDANGKCDIFRTDQ